MTATVRIKTFMVKSLSESGEKNTKAFDVNQTFPFQLPAWRIKPQSPPAAIKFLFIIIFSSTLTLSVPVNRSVVLRRMWRLFMQGNRNVSVWNVRRFGFGGEGEWRLCFAISSRLWGFSWLETFGRLRGNRGKTVNGGFNEKKKIKKRKTTFILNVIE